jgi:importin subunit beta-1
MALADDAKNKVKQDSLVTLQSPNIKIALVAGQVIAAIAAIELPNNQWQDLIKILLEFASQATNTGLKIASLQTIGYICESVVSYHAAN